MLLCSKCEYGDEESMTVYQGGEWDGYPDDDRDTAYMMEAHLSKPNEWGGIKHEN